MDDECGIGCQSLCVRRGPKCAGADRGDLGWLFNGLVTSPSHIGINVSTGDHLYFSRPFDSATLAPWLQNGQTLWMSWIANGGANTNRRTGVILSSGPTLRDRGVSLATGQGGEGAGATTQAVGGFNSNIHVVTYKDSGGDGTSEQIYTSGNNSGSLSAGDHLIIVKFVWGAMNNAPDTVSVYNLSEPAPGTIDLSGVIDEAFFNANAKSVTQVLDQEAFTNVVGMSIHGFAHFDELRIATTFDEVIGISPPEEEIERRITAISRDDVSGMLTLHWTSQAGETFGIYWSTDLKTFYPDMHQSIPANPTAAETSFGPFASPAPNADRLFLRIGPPDIEPPTLAAISGDGIEITLAYSEPMIEGSATDPANYSLVLVGGGAIGVLSARLGETPGTVILTVAENLVFGVGYRLSVAGVTDPGGLAIAAGTEADFSPWNPGTGVVPLIISEFMAANSASPRNTEVLSDEDGETSDWIEIHNPLGAAVDLEGWFLTDNASNLTKWRFPAVSLAPGARLLVFASGKDRTNPAARLHTNFQLSGSGYLGLVMPDGQTVAFGFAPAYPAQEDGVSFGLPEGSAAGIANYRYFDTPTPELEPHLSPRRINVDTGACYGGPLTAVVLSPKTVKCRIPTSDNPVAPQKTHSV